ncbi:MAG: adenylate/guanylate cyclase domain-containing protein [Deltaproteobacteria bacterium]|nr:adenylate/guanylate cyclase domain-containing protein [Deltaproteobacteria bacterium]MBI3389327.1 adenylate/guanylate cyclase domain-containing protein [Deltaproteobacteria bacterium]
MTRPPVHYATTADGIEIAYQVLGDGPIDVVIVPGMSSNLDWNAELPFYGGYLRRFPRFARTIALDRRGGGVSDREVGSGSAEDRMDDVRVVMDAVGCQRAALLGQVEGGAIAVLFAATYPERVSALVLVETSARRLSATDYPAGQPAEWIEATISHNRTHWGTGRALFPLTCDARDEEAAVAALAVLERSIGTPRTIGRQRDFSFSVDVRAALPLIEVPALVTHARRSVWSESQVRYTADHIRDARYVETEKGYANWDPAEQDAFVDIIEEFLTGQRPPVHDIDRVLATVLYTDIVDSTRRAAELGDRHWRDVLDAHDAQAAAEVTRFRGRIVKQTGDGHLAVFDGPARAIRCAQAMAAAARGLGVEIRAGLHTGEIEQRGEDVSGLAVHIGARIVALAGPGEVLVSSTVRELVVGSGLEFDDRGEHELRGVAGVWRLLAARVGK